MLIAHKTRLHPNNQQLAFFKQCAGVRRFAYNWALGEIKREYEQGVVLKPSDADKRLNAIKKDQFPWMYDVPSCVGQEAIKGDLKAAFQGFFSRVKKKVKGEAFGFPQFKKKGQRDSFALTNVHLKAEAIKGISLTLPKKMGAIRMGDAIRFKGKLMSTTISRSGENWYASFLLDTEQDIQYLTPPQGSKVGVDMGVAHMVALSTGELFPPANALVKHQKRLTREQRSLSRKQQPDFKKGVKASTNWKKQQAKVRKIHRKIANFRENYAHQVTTRLANCFETIVIEDLKIKNMSASAKGDAENPGKNVKQKAGLNRAILDGAWYKFRAMLDYKAARRGGLVIAVNPQYTSRTCPACGHESKENRPTRDTFACTACGYSGHADIVAANNILTRGLASLESSA